MRFLTFFTQLGVVFATVSLVNAGEYRSPRDTTYMNGRKDFRGTPITCSKPVKLGPLNESSKLKDNDYSFEPQKAYEVVNFERFPPFKMNSKFLTVWDTKRYTDEPLFGGPLNRGFTMVAHETPQEKLQIAQRAYFGYPGEVEGTIKEMVAKNGAKYQDLVGWADVKYRSAWVCASNAYDLGWNYYNNCSWNGSREFGLFSWDEEEMWWTRGVTIFKEHPEWLPEDLKMLKQKDPEATDPATVSAIENSYRAAWAEFLGNGYKGAVDCAASRGNRLKIYHYGSLGIGEIRYGLYYCTGDPSAETPAKAEKVSDLFDWYTDGSRVDFSKNTFTKTVQYYHKDSYFFFVGPQILSMYEKAQDGSYGLDTQGRRKLRTDVAEEYVYAKPTQVGYEDFGAAPANLKEFIAKGENTLFWLNGGKYYKQSGTLTSSRRGLPTMRPGNQETMGKAAELGSRPVTPYLAEGAVIFNFMLGNEGFFLWDENRQETVSGQQARPENKPAIFGDEEFMIKGLHRLSQFNKLFDGRYSFVRPTRQQDVFNRDHPIIRGIINGRYLLLAMMNPYLDFGESQEVEIWYDAPDAQKSKWSDKVSILPRRTHLFQCKLPAPPKEGYDPDKLFFRYTCVDGNYRKSFTLSGNYNVPFCYK